MKKTERNPKKAMLLMVATALALAVCVYTVNNAIGGGAPPPAAVPDPAAAKTAAAPAESVKVVMATDTVQSPVVGTAAAEAQLAADADPFAPLAVEQPAAIKPPPPAAPTSSMPSMTAHNRIISRMLPDLGNPGMPLVTKPIEQVQPPVFAGTLLGQRPSALFKTDKALQIIPVGGTIHGWRVVSVSHGGAVVRLAGRSVQLGVAYSPSTAVTTAEEFQPESDLASRSHLVRRPVADENNPLGDVSDHLPANPSDGSQGPLPVDPSSAPTVPTAPLPGGPAPIQPKPQEPRKDVPLADPLRPVEPPAAPGTPVTK